MKKGCFFFGEKREEKKCLMSVCLCVSTKKKSDWLCRGKEIILNKSSVLNGLLQGLRIAHLSKYYFSLKAQYFPGWDFTWETERGGGGSGGAAVSWRWLAGTLHPDRMRRHSARVLWRGKGPY